MKFLQALLGRKAAAPSAAPFVETAPNEIVLEGAPPFPIAKSIVREHGFPLVDWDAVNAWLAQVDTARRNEAWKACERGWLMHLEAALGANYRLAESPIAVVLSSLEDKLAHVTVDYMERTLARITRVLDGLARAPEMGKEILVVFDDEDTYYRYASIYVPDGEQATSGGMYLGSGCGHFVMTKADLHRIEPVIAHELTHSCLEHLDLPTWLNEGLAENTKGRLTRSARPQFTPQQMHEKHLAFWNEARIQEFWKGDAFYEPDAQNLAYDLARIIVEQLATDWDTLKAFALAAKEEDAGAAAARQHLGVDLGEYVCALLEKLPSPRWSPSAH